MCTSHVFLVYEALLLSLCARIVKIHSSVGGQSHREKIKQVGKSEDQSILVVLTHSCYHIKEKLSKEGCFPDPLYCFGWNPDMYVQ